MKLRMHVDRRKIGDEGRNDGGRMKRRRAGRRGFIYRYPRWRSSRHSSASLVCPSLGASHVCSRSERQLSPYWDGRRPEANTDSTPVRTRLGQQTVSHFRLTLSPGYRSQLPSSVQSQPLHTRWFATLFTIDDLHQQKPFRIS